MVDSPPFLGLSGLKWVFPRFSGQKKPWKALKMPKKRPKKAQNRDSLWFWTGETTPPLSGLVQLFAEENLMIPSLTPGSQQSQAYTWASDVESLTVHKDTGESCIFHDLAYAYSSIGPRLKWENCCARNKPAIFQTNCRKVVVEKS